VSILKSNCLQAILNIPRPRNQLSTSFSLDITLSAPLDYVLLASVVFDPGLQKRQDKGCQILEERIDLISLKKSAIMEEKGKKSSKNLFKEFPPGIEE